MSSGLFDGIEKLINEHGSSAILREHLASLKDQFASLEKQLSVCKNEVSSLKEKISQLESVNENLKLKYNTLNEQIKSFHDENPHSHRCRHCGSIKLKRVSGEPGDTGVVDTFFICQDCHKESVITINTLQ
jgi:predicted nuclease with TOPRIM domain